MRKPGRLLALLLLPVMLSSCEVRVVGKGTDNYPREFKSRGSRSMNAKALEDSIFRGINQYRQTNGLPPLKRSRGLDAMARNHSQQMIDRGRLSHDGFDSRAADAEQSDNFTKVTENVAYNQNAPDPAVTAIEGWIESSGHNRNILDPDATETGIGVTIQGSTVYATQMFGGN